MSLIEEGAFMDNLWSRLRSFEELKTELWDWQYHHNLVMKDFSDRLEAHGPISMPIGFFKHFEMKTGLWQPELIFESSGTTGQTPSRHLVRNAELYRKNVLYGFRHFFEEGEYRILALLPSYLERGNSSLVYMVKCWMDTFGLPGSGFYLRNTDELRKSIYEAAEAGERILLIGVTFALLDFVEEEAVSLPPDTLVIETGGMKGREKEWVRSQLHERLKVGFGLNHIYSEYGMTELMSQAYTDDRGRFRPTPTMEVYVSDIHLDRLIQPAGMTGRLHIIDLANVHSCAFIATDDVGVMHEDGSFEVLGRLDTAEIRGCSLMYT